MGPQFHSSILQAWVSGLYDLNERQGRAGLQCSTFLGHWENRNLNRHFPHASAALLHSGLTTLGISRLPCSTNRSRVRL